MRFHVTNSKYCVIMRANHSLDTDLTASVAVAGQPHRGPDEAVEDRPQGGWRGPGRTATQEGPASTGATGDEHSNQWHARTERQILRPTQHLAGRSPRENHRFRRASAGNCPVRRSAQHLAGRLPCEDRWFRRESAVICCKYCDV